MGSPRPIQKMWILVRAIFLAYSFLPMYAHGEERGERGRRMGREIYGDTEIKRESMPEF